MPRGDYKRCKRCGRHAKDCGPLSHERYCFPCGQVLYRENALQLHAHNGPAFDRWRRRSIIALGAVPLEDVR